MTLNAIKGNMFKYLGPDIPPMVATFNPICGCTNSCAYCHTNWGYKLNMTPRFRPNYLKDDLYKHGKGTIFVGSVADWGCPEVEIGWIQDVLKHCHNFPENTYLIQSKTPDVFLRLLHPEFKPGFPKNTILATTMETNFSGNFYRELTGCKAKQTPWGRMFSMRAIGNRDGITKMITVEPIIEMSPVALANYIAYAQVDIVTIGANSYYGACPLSEPSADDIEALVKRLSNNSRIKAIILKSNLKRLLDGIVLDYPGVYDMSKKKGDPDFAGWGWEDAVSWPRGAFTEKGPA